MTGPAPRGFDEPAPSVSVAAQLRTSAGSPVRAPLTIVNTSPEPRVMAVTAMGVDADWLPAPTRSRPLLPGEQVVADLVLQPSTGTMPARYPLALAVQALDPASGRAMSPVAISDVTLVVDAAGNVGISVQPATPSAVFGKKIFAVLHNTGATTEDVTLHAQSARAAAVYFPTGPIAVPAGQTVQVPGRVKITRPRFVGRRARHAFTVSARTAGAPRHAECAVVARPVLAPSGARLTAFVAVVALWVALALLLIPKLSHSVQHSVAAPKTSTVTSTSAAPGKGGSGGAGSGGSGGGGSGSGGSGSGGSGSGGSGSGGSGSGGSGSGGSGSGGSGGSGSGSSNSAASGTSMIQLNGTVAGASPSGVDVSLAPTSLDSTDSLTAKPIGFDPDSGPVAKLTPLAVSTTALQQPRRQPGQAPASTGDRAITTSGDGTWAFPQVRAPGYYLVTFAKPGYQTQRYIIDASSPAAIQPLKVSLTPGQGTLSGAVTSGGNAVGGAQLSISDGTTTITTTSDSKGVVGQWSVNGLSTPGSYLVTATHDGMGAESELVQLSAGGSQTVSLDLPQGVTTLLGTISATQESGGPVRVGGITVTATDGDVVHTSTTVTTAGAALGNYRLPDLAPGTYTVTIAGQGYLTQTQSVTVKLNESAATLNASLTPSTGSVSGSLVFGNVPDPADPSTSLAGRPIEGAGLMLSSSSGTTEYKVTSLADGTFGFAGVTPGTYVLSAQYSGLTTAYVTVTVVAGQDSPGNDFVLTAAPVVNTSIIEGTVSGSRSPSGTLICQGAAGSNSASPSASASGSSSSSGSSGSPSATSTSSGNCQVTVSFTLYSVEQGQDVDISSDSAAPYTSPTTLAAATSGPTGYSLSAQDGLAPGLYRLTIGATPGYLPATVNVRVPDKGTAIAPSVTLHTANAISGTISVQGDPFTDGPQNVPAGGFVNCVWAIPTFDYTTGLPNPGAQTAPTSCTPPPASEDTCTTEGEPTSAVAMLTPGTIAGTYVYNDVGLCDGTYTVWVFTNNDWYQAPANSVQEYVAGGQTVDYSTHIQRDGRVVLSLTEIDSADGSSSTPTGGLTGSVECGVPQGSTGATVSGDSYGDLSTVGSAGTVTVSGVASGSGSITCVTVGAQQTQGSTQISLSGSTSGLTVSSDNDTSAAMTLTNTGGVGELVGQVQVTYGGAAHGVAGATVSVTGIVGYDGTTPRYQSVTLTTDSAGCFALTPDGKGAVTDGPTGCTTVSTPENLSNPQAGATFVSGKFSQVGVGATMQSSSYSASDVTFTVGTLKAIPVTVAPSTASGLLVTFNPSTADGTQASVTVSTKPAESGAVTGAVSGVQGAYSLGLSDTAYSGSTTPNTVSPGTYTVTVALTGYSSATAQITCSPGYACTFATESGNTSPDSLTLGGLAHLDGTVNGLLSNDTSDTMPTQTIGNASVALVPCSTGTCATATASSSDPSTTSGGNGAYTFGAGNNLQPGRYVLVSSASGYDGDVSTPFTLTAGQSSSVNPLLDVKLVTLDLTVTLGQTTTTTTHAVVTVTSLSNPNVTSTQYYDSTSQSYHFTDLIPGGYSYSITGDGSTDGSEIQATNGQLTPIPFNTSSTTATNSQSVAVASYQTTLSGQVTAPSGASGTAGLNGVTVEMGTISGGTFTTSNDLGGNPLSVVTSTVSGQPGSYTFSRIPAGQYVVRINVTKPVPGYGSETSQTVTIQTGQSSNLTTAPLSRVTHTVQVTVTASQSGDTISGSTNVQLTSLDTSGYSIVAGPATTSGKNTVWSFNQVPFGCWSFTLTLPTDHYGTPTQTTGQGTLCSGTSGFTVPTTSGGDPVAVGFTLDEYQPSASVTLTPLKADPTKPPPTVTVSVTQGGATRYSDPSFTVSSTAAALPVWVSGDATVALDVGLNNWKNDSQPVSEPSSSAALTGTELGGSVTVTVTENGKFPTGSVAVTLNQPAMTNYTYSQPGTVSTTGGTYQVTFNGIPYASGWSATATITSGTDTYTATSGDFTSSSTAATTSVDVTS